MTQRDVPQIRTTLPGPKAAAMIARDHACVSPSYTRAYPLVVARGAGCTIEDVDGNRFLDFTAGIAVNATGHCHPKVVAAIKAQAERLLHMSGTDFYYEPQVTLSERLAKLAPGKTPKKVFLCNSGTEAIEGAMKLARWHTKRKQFIAFVGSFHGRTLGALSLTSSKAVQREHFFPLVPGVTHATFPDPYRTPDGTSADAHARACVAWIRDRLFTTVAPPGEIAGIVVEPIQGEGGYVIPPTPFHRELKTLCEEHGILYIADEVQSGMGRTGKMFACEHFGVEPDIICTAKGIASGLPLGAIIANADLMDWTPGSHASTFGGNPVACAAALATIELLQGLASPPQQAKPVGAPPQRRTCGLEHPDGLMANATTQGARLMQGLRGLQRCHPLIGDVRGLGLMVGMELVRDRNTKTRATEERNRLVQAAFQKGLLLLGCGQNTIRFCPPLVVTADEVDTALEIVDHVLDDIG